MTTPENASGAAPDEKGPRLGEEHSLTKQEARAIDGSPELSPLGASAVQYAASGLAVFPLWPDSARPRITEWPDRATTDTATVASWWREWPSAGVGIVTGKSRLLVVDVDVKNDPFGASGYQSLLGFLEDHPHLEPHFRSSLLVHTRSGGAHHVWRLPEGAEVTTVRQWLPDVDLLASGNFFVVAPPTPREFEGRESSYRLVRGDFGQVPVADPALLDALRVRHPRQRSGDAGGWSAPGQPLPSDAEVLARGLPPGNRNNLMHALACRWWRTYGLANETAVRSRAYQVWSATQGHDTFPWSEALGAVQSAEAYITERIHLETRAVSAWMRARFQR